jgi:SAM-dependent methyltransferase
VGQPPRLSKSAERGEPSHVWRAGQERRLQMIRRAAPQLASARVLVDGCGLGMYVRALAPLAREVFGLDIEVERVREGARAGIGGLMAGQAEALPFASNVFDLVLSHEVLEHVANDRQAVREILRVLRPGGRLVLFVPNRGYPFETHGVYWRGRYHFGNIPLLNYLPRAWRDRLAPHVRAYTTQDLCTLVDGLPARPVLRTIIFGGYDNIVARAPRLGRILRGMLQALERTPLRIFGLSHLWVVEKTAT